MSVQSVIRAVRASRVTVLSRLSSAPEAFHRHRFPLSSPSVWPLTRSYSLYFDQQRYAHTQAPGQWPGPISHSSAVHASSLFSRSHHSTGEESDTPTASIPFQTGRPQLSGQNSVQSHGMWNRKRYIFTGRLHAGIEKKRTTRVRSFSSSSKESSNGASSSITNGNEKSKDVTWREALTSPRKAIAYCGQLRRDLVSWAKHMWAGGKLLAADVRVSTKILRRVTAGKQLTRRERNFIVQTGVDLARLVPFSLFLIIPLAEFALPFALRLFPHMLPSQFQDQMKEEEKLKKRLKARLELAKYLREVVEEKAKLVKASDVNSELKKNAEDLTEFLDAVRSGKDVSQTEISRFAKFFNDELTIDGAVRPQLVAMCKYMGISPYGHDMFLRFKLRSRLNAIKKDDMQIMWEGGVGSLTDAEVAKACRDRGIREEVSNKWMREQISDWLDLSQRREIPGSLLIMSRAFLYARVDGVAEDKEDGLVETLGSMPDDVIMDVKQAADVGEGSTQERLEETLRQAKLIELESEREARKEKEDQEKRKKKEAVEEEAERVAEEAAAVEEKQGTTDTISDKEVLEKVENEEEQIREKFFGDTRSASEKGTVGSQKDEPVTDTGSDGESKNEEELLEEHDRMREMVVSLGELSSDSSVEKEREELRNLKLQLAEAEILVKGTEGESSSDMRRFKNLVAKLGREIERVDTKVGLRMKLLDKDNDGLMSLEECRSAMTLIVGERDDNAVAETLQRLDADADGNISKADLTRLLHEMQFEYGVIEEPTKAQESKDAPLSAPSEERKHVSNSK